MAAVTGELVHRWKREFLAGTYRRGKAADAKAYTRSATSCATYFRSLRSLWQRHWRPAGFVRSNPWLDVPYPNTPRGRRVRLPPEDAVGERLMWLDRRHPGWELQRAAGGAKHHRPATRTLARSAFDPSTWRWTVQNLFREFKAGRPPSARVRPHDLRARAITLMAAASQSVGATAEALGIDPQTARHYLDRATAFFWGDSGTV